MRPYYKLYIKKSPKSNRRIQRLRRSNRERQQIFLSFYVNLFALLIVPLGWIWGIWIESFSCVVGEFQAQEETIKGTRGACPALISGQAVRFYVLLTERHLLRYIGCSKNRFTTARCCTQRRTTPHLKLEPQFSDLDKSGICLFLFRRWRADNMVMHASHVWVRGTYRGATPLVCWQWADMLKTCTLESIVLGITYNCGFLRTVFWK